MKIQRIIQPQIENRMVPGKVVVLLGPRQVGKTTLLKDILSKETAPFLFVWVKTGQPILAWQSKHRNPPAEYWQPSIARGGRGQARSENWLETSFPF